ncbi:uncharacterized protein LOC107008280 isoform X1 [Solanum pennellii]|uniref:Uncharacterized protein LOC107008280 isoform X1 n=1 Tax=Solanum pennellii TaxID=28526 RepID=A0ABM1FWR4_SOLPN|nr:uncharacterized protein LOC107008280 isoform X1 [Solanum pennellii]XP_015062743.1 uncharacterized protein LOC107008280 isoform X1 [Solanum pennellii]
MSSGDGPKVSCEEIQMVQNRIEHCLRQYMSRKEVVNTLFIQDNIEPTFTELVWQKLEEENQEFFQAYYLKLMVKEQIIEFNRLLSEQVKMTQQVPSAIASLPMSNGCNIMPMHQNSTCGAAENVGTAAKPNGMHKPVHADRPNAFSNSSSSVLSCMQTTIDIPSQSRKIDGPPNMFLGQPSNMGMRQTMDGRIIKTEPIYGGNSPFAFGPHGTYLESRSAMGDASVSSFSSVESNTQPLNEPLLDADTSSFGFLGEIPQNFGFSDLTADFTNTSDILGSYSRTPFLATDTGNLLDSNGGIERLTNPSENLRYTNFSGD